MKRQRLPIVRAGMLALVIVALLAALAPIPALGAGRPVTIFTRNLYLGADLAPVFAAPTPEATAVAVARVFAMVQATDFPERADLLAREIRDTDPDLVGLQEVALWRSGAPGVLDGPATPATTVRYDFLALLLDALAARGLRYAVVVVQETSDGEVPSALGYDLRLTQRNAILVKTDQPSDKLILANATAATFATNLTIPTALGPIADTRGWTAVDVTVQRRSFRLINTHLDSTSAYHRFAQAGELLSGPARTALPVVLVGDLNADPGEPGPFSPYARLVGAGFADAWAVARHGEPGPTCCHTEDLRNPAPSLTTRIDHVLVRPDISVVRARLIGLDPDNRTTAGLWPSDHAGVAVILAP